MWGGPTNEKRRVFKTLGMNKRAYTLDLLRGLAIIGMVLSGQMLWNAELPAWLFHAQLPPPTFAFDPSVPGITWVDLVFPFFLFSMGAAFPLALRRRMEVKGESVAAIVMTTVRRWLYLVIFAIVLENLRVGYIEGVPQWGAALVSLAEWGCFSLLFLQFPNMDRKLRGRLRLVGFAGLAALLLLVNKLWGVETSLYKSDIIMLILANMVLFGTIIWIITRKSLIKRLAIFAFLVALRLGSGVEGSWCSDLWESSFAPWLFKFDYLKYLCIILPGTIAGDMIYKWLKLPEHSESTLSCKRELWMVAVGLLLIVVNMWGLFTRHLVWCVVLSIVLGIVVRILLSGGKSDDEILRKRLFEWGLFWLLLGLFVEPFEGGIKKDFATFSYFFVTSGLASVVLVVSSVLIQRGVCRFSPIIKCGENPMIAYTAASLLIAPILVLTQLSPILDKLWTLTPWMGFLRGVVITIAVVAITAYATKRKFMWRS